MTKQATGLLIWTKTRLGRKVPDYARKVLHDRASEGDCKRAPVELNQMLTQLRNSDRERLFAENPKLKQWYAQQPQAEIEEYA